jgi:uncharacterized protein
MTAYAETCAAIGMDYWNHRLFLLHGDAKYIDVMERTLYNGLVSGVALDGKTFFYPNPSSRTGSTSAARVVRRGVLPGQHHALHGVGARLLLRDRGDTLYVNLFAPARPTSTLGSGRREARPGPRYPWDGASGSPCAGGDAERSPSAYGSRLGPQRAGAERPVSLRREPEDAAVKVNGDAVPRALDKGYVTIDRTWQAGDVIEIDLPMPVRRVVGAREGRGESRARGAAARPDRVRRRVARQPERQGEQHRAARCRRARVGVPRRPAQRRPGRPRPRVRADH